MIFGATLFATSCSVGLFLFYKGMHWGEELNGMRSRQLRLRLDAVANENRLLHRKVDQLTMFGVGNGHPHQGQ